MRRKAGADPQPRQQYGAAWDVRVFEEARAKRVSTPPGRLLLELSRHRLAVAPSPPPVRRSVRSRRSHPDCHGSARAAPHQASAA
jgi:hypothetical protein